jgi:hypothetical protein
MIGYSETTTYTTEAGRAIAQASYRGGTGSIQLVFLVKTVTLDEVYLREFHFPPVTIIPPKLRTDISFVYHRRCVILATDSVFN